MPSPRRMRLLAVAAIATLFVLYFYSSTSGQTRDGRLQDFYHKTMDARNRGASSQERSALGAQRGSRPDPVAADRDGDGDVDADDRVAAMEMRERLDEAALKAKEKANEKGGLRPDPPSNVIGVGSSAEGQKKLAGGGGGDDNDGDLDAEEESAKKVTKEEEEAKEELNSILKKSPVIIFSKTRCPFSKRAKQLLMQKYTITPEPYVAELDVHPLGQALQDQLLEKTGRRTVPNILVYDVSLGGADDIVALDNDEKLVSKIVELGNKHVTMERASAD